MPAAVAVWLFYGLCPYALYPRVPSPPAFGVRKTRRRCAPPNIQVDSATHVGRTTHSIHALIAHVDEPLRRIPLAGRSVVLAEKASSWRRSCRISEDDRDAFRKNPYFREEDQIKGDFTPFYVAITICSIIGGFLLIINIAFCYCSQYKGYWKNRNTGNRWIQSLWTVTPHNNPPLDLSELEEGVKTYRANTHNTVQYFPEDTDSIGHQQGQQYMELQKRESDI